MSKSSKPQVDGDGFTGVPSRKFRATATKLGTIFSGLFAAPSRSSSPVQLSNSFALLGEEDPVEKGAGQENKNGAGQENNNEASDLSPMVEPSATHEKRKVTRRLILSGLEWLCRRKSVRENTKRQLLSKPPLIC